jgi:hypothetical protein
LFYGDFEWKALQIKHFWLVAPIVVLSIFNWFCEYVKWSVILSHSHVKFDFLKKSKSLSAGVLSQFFVPWFFGNLIGRLAYIEKPKRVEVGLIVLWSNLAQYIPTLFFGCIGLYFLENRSNVNNLIYYNSYWLAGSCCLLLFTCIFYFSSHKVFKRIRILKKYFSPEIEITVQLKQKLLLFSFLRYGGFVFQYFLVLSIFEDLNVEVYPSIMIMYLFLTMIPSIFFGKLGIREAVSVTIIGVFLNNATLAVTCSILVWFINNVIALIPSFVINSKNT